MTDITTKDGDMIDALAYRHYGAEGHLPAVLEANPHLAQYGPVLPAGVVISFPEIAAPSAPTRATIRLWGNA